MDQYLNDSPADLNASYGGSAANDSRSGGTGNSNRSNLQNNSYFAGGNNNNNTNNQNSHNEPYYGNNQMLNTYAPIDTLTDPLNGFDITSQNLQNSTDPDFELNLEYAALGGAGAPLTGNSNPVLSENEYLSPVSANNYNAASTNLASSLGNDAPFISVGYDNQASSQFGDQMSPQLGGVPINMGFDNPSSFPGNHGDFGGMSNANTLDGLISPDNNQLSSDAFLHFSPSQRLSFNQDNSRMGPTAIPSRPMDLMNQGYLSPQQHGYLSPTGGNGILSGNDNSFDTIRSPNMNSNYLYSPQQKAMAMAIPQTSTSTPGNNQLLSPPGNSQLSTSVPSRTVAKSPPSRDVPTKLLTNEEKIKRRKEFHNAVERRRRDLIKQRIKELDAIVPPSLLNPQLCALQAMEVNQHLNTKELNELAGTMKVKETKANKNTILSKSVVYMRHLQHVLDEQSKARKKLEEEIALLEGSSGQLISSQTLSSGNSIPQMPQQLVLLQLLQQQQQQQLRQQQQIKSEPQDNNLQNWTNQDYGQMQLSQNQNLEQLMSNQDFDGQLQGFDAPDGANLFNPDDFFDDNVDFNNMI